MEEKEDKEIDIVKIVHKLLEKEENTYRLIIKMAKEIKDKFDLQGERDDTLILKVLEEFSKKSE
jgi:hypothetical protein